MSTITAELDQRTYVQLLERTLPHVIHTDEELERFTNELMRLDELDATSREEKEVAELLTLLIDEYEERRHPIRKATPQQTLQHLMEARELTQKDLWKTFGSKGITSEVFHGKRSISKAQARKLARLRHPDEARHDRPPYPADLNVKGGNGTGKVQDRDQMAAAPYRAACARQEAFNPIMNCWNSGSLRSGSSSGSRAYHG